MRPQTIGKKPTWCGWLRLFALAGAFTVPPAQAAIELLAEHIEFYISSGASSSTDLPGCADTTDNLYGEFGDAGGWARTWWANANAWEGDWKSSTLAGGNDADWSDDDDFGYFCGHGNVGLVEFTTFNPGRIFNNNEGRWGDEDAEWITFDTSLTLRDTGSNLDTWYVNAFAGLHLLVGWHDSPLDGDTGGEYADELIDWGAFDGGGDTVTEAWFSGSGGCTDQNDGTTQMILAEVEAHYDDHIHGQGSLGSDQPNNGTYWTWDHDC
ncbi:MAG: DUF6345 domain-containing protein [Acidobacteria bacterium]|nr:DUF6345 domain-containing protein [Acidobacteriota bacterium]